MLDLPQVTGWADFVFGPLFEATADGRPAPPAAAPARRTGARAGGCGVGPVVVCICGTSHCCACGHPTGHGEPDDRRDTARRGVLNGDKPSGPALVDGKPSGHTLVEGKPSGHALVEGKPSGHALGPHFDD